MAQEIHQKIVIDAQIKTTLNDMNKVVSDLQAGLEKGITKADLSKGIGNSLSKTMDSFKQEFQNFSKLTSGGKLDFADSKEAIRSGEAVLKHYREIQRVVENINTMQVGDAKKMFPAAFDSRIGDLQGKVSILQDNLNSLRAKEIDLSAAETRLQGLNGDLDNLKAKLIDETQLVINVTQAQARVDETKAKVEEIRSALQQELKLKLAIEDEKVAQTTAKIEEIKNARSIRGTSKISTQGGHVQFEGKTAKQWENSGASKEQITAAKQAIQLYAQEENQLKSLNQALDDAKTRATQLREAFTGFGEKTDLAKMSSLLGKSGDDIQAAKNAMQEQTEATNAAKIAQEQLGEAQRKNNTTNTSITKTTRDIQEQEARVTKLREQYDLLFGKVDTTALANSLQAVLGKDFTPEMLTNQQGIEGVLAKLREMDGVSFEKLKAELATFTGNSKTAERYVEQLREGLLKLKDSKTAISESAREMEMFTSRVKYFFSITNSVQLFKRAVRSALNTVKELDKTMTEAAVVTRFDVGDMWRQLPEYTKQASQLGVSINGMYQATTLYYQQGLKTNQAMELGVETMKMARIAGIDSAEATTAMTAALRGFNMELNELSATRINDVYSQLAAVTAADVNKISTAMEKTASIAASANMEFETTAALLAQIIETTQEAPETAGTAMKTIIARFAEVKSLREKGERTGKDSEGEDIDVNKIQTALRSVGLSMDGFFAGTEGLDSVLLKLAEKWDTLDFETQRYIATMAAGSRQQSRFIAMMSDYKRTMELVDQAQNSSGASSRQFEKTLESMESKLAQLDNAWDEFLMGLANNKILKGGIDALTFILEQVNKLTSSLSGSGGLIQSILSLTTVIGALKIGKMALGAGLGFVGRSMGLGGASGQPNAVQQMTGPNVQKQGELEGQKAGTGFKAGWNRAMATGKQGGGFMARTGSFFYSKDLQAQRLSGRFAKAEGKALARLQSGAVGAQDPRAHTIGTITGLNTNLTPEQTSQIVQEYDTVYAKTNDVAQASAAAGAKVQAMGGTLLSTGEKAKLSGGMMKMAGLDFKAMGSSAMGASMAIGLLASWFDQMGWEGAAETARDIASGVMLVGLAFMILPPVFSAVGKAAKSLQKSFGWIGVVIAAIVALAAIVAIVVAAMQTDELAENLKKAKEATEAARESAEKAKEAYENLMSSNEAYKEAQTAIQGLSKNTKEWNQALLEANSTVLDVLSNYPELIDYVSKGAQGQLILSEAGWEKATDKALEAQRKAQGQVAIGQAETVLAEAEIKIREYAEDANFDEDDFRAVLEKYVNNPNLFTDNESFKDLQTATGLATKDLREMAGVVGKCAAEVGAMETNAKKYNQMAIESNIDDSKLEYEYLDQLTSGVAAIVPTAEKLVAKYGKDDGSGFKAQVTDNDLAQFGLKKADLTGENEADIQKVYMAMMGIASVEDIPEEMQDYTKQLAVVGKQMSLNNQAKNIETIIGRLESKNSADERRLVSALSRDSSKVGYKDLNALEEITGKSLAEELGVTEEFLAQYFGVKVDQIDSLLDEFATKTQNKWNNIMEVGNKTIIGFKDKFIEFNNQLLDAGSAMGMTSEQANQLVHSLSAVDARGGKAEITMSYFSDVLKWFSGADLDSAINLISSTDWTSKNEIDNTIEGLRALGANIGGDFVREIYKATGAVRKFSLSDFKERLGEIDEVIKNVQDKAGSQEKTYTDEEKDAMVAQGIESSSFVYVGFDEWVYMGTTEDLLRQLNTSVDDIYKEIKEDATEEFKTGTRIGQALRQEGKSKNTGWNVMTEFLTGSGVSILDEYGETDTLGNEMTLDQKTRYFGKYGEWVDDIYNGSGFELRKMGDATSYYKTVGEGEDAKAAAYSGMDIVNMFISGEGTVRNNGSGDHDKANLHPFVPYLHYLAYGTYEGLPQTEEGFTNDYINELKADLTEARDNALKTGDKKMDNEFAVWRGEPDSQTATYESVDTILKGLYEWHKDPTHKSGIDWGGEGSDINGGVKEEDLKSIAVYLGYSEEEIKDKSAQELAIMLAEGYEAYLDTSANGKQIIQTSRIAAQQQGYSKAGSKETGKALAKGGLPSWITTNSSEMELFENVANGQYSTEQRGQMDTLANDLGISETENMTIDELAIAIAEKWNDTYALEEGVDAYVQQNAGLQLITDQLAEQNEEWQKNPVLVKNAVAGIDKSSKAWKQLNAILDDNADKLNSKDALERAAAIQAVATETKKTFGEDFGEEFVQENLEAFQQLAEGGEEAEAAWEKIKEAAKIRFVATLDPTINAIDLYNFEASVEDQLQDAGLGIPVVLDEATVATAKNNYEKFMTYMATQGISLQAIYDENGLVTDIIATRTSGATTFVPSGGGGGSSSQYENSYDKLHNVLEEINDLLREREKLERQYQRLLDRNLATTEKLAKLSQNKIDTYQQEIARQNYIIDERQNQIDEEVAKNPNLQKFVKVEEGLDGNRSIRIDWYEFEKLKNSDTGEKADAYYDDIKTWLESIYEAQVAIEEAQDAIYEELAQGKDEYLDLESQVKDAIVESRQKQIDELSNINDSITDANSKLIESMQSSLDKYRQNRDNEKTEEELSDKQRRLAYLQQDTTGANAMDILELQKEIEEGQESYTDQLIDQKITELQEQNDKAAEQRQEQIDILQEQLDKYSESSEIWDEVGKLIQEGVDETGKLREDSDLAKLLKDSAMFEGLSRVQKMDWMNQTNNQLAAALKWLSGGALATMAPKGSTVSFKNGSKEMITGTVGEYGEVVTEDGSIYKDVDMDAYGNYYTSETAEKAAQERDNRAKPANPEYKSFHGYVPHEIQRTLRNGHSGKDVASMQAALIDMKYLSKGEDDGIFGPKTQSALRNFQADFKKSNPDVQIGSPDGIFGPNTKNAFKIMQYKTGGLADFTGPAWLDGTKSKPEYILNADQTKAFFNLVDVLGSLRTGTSQTTQNSGDNTYDIDINVESIGSDYDVEQLAETIKRLINEDARYRNNNAINLMR